jgi:hypothetical protein
MRKSQNSGRCEAISGQKVLRTGGVSHVPKADLPTNHVLPFLMRVYKLVRALDMSTNGHFCGFTIALFKGRKEIAMAQPPSHRV